MPVSEPNETPGGAGPHQPEAPTNEAESTPTPTGGAATPSPSTGGQATVSKWLWLWTALAAGLVGLGAWYVGERAYGLFNTPFVEPSNWGEMGPYEKEAYIVDFERNNKPPDETKNTAFALGVLGALLGGGLGLVGGLLRGSSQACLRAGLVGVFGGGLAGAIGSLVMGPVFFNFLKTDSGLLLPFVTHGVIFALIGAVSGLALGYGIGGRLAAFEGLFGGAFGGILGAGIFEIVYAFGFPLVRAHEPIPAAMGARLAAHVITAILIALLAAAAIQSSGAPKKPRKAA